ncbi:histidinol-phosphate transaminase [Bacillus litorisediminis]|uniref:histidinol-phosphate transaminase n=1 Tax=Bacillus litorisediminis TaxID=2922713 RepID=UPI001FACAF19|nr:histidinol-phosphate transaminase [Bacillus litorisediminis]
MKWIKQLDQLKAYQPGKTIDEVKKEFGLDTIIKLASNENPYGHSKKVDELFQNTKFQHMFYPDGAATELRQAVAEHFGIDPANLIFGNGSDEIIQIISNSLIEPGINTVMPVPSFSQYKHNCFLQGGESREIPLINGEHDLNGMLDAIDENTSIVWICNPNNPSGRYIPKDDLFAFLEKVPSHVLVVIDQAYHEYVTAPDYPDSLSIFNAFDNVMLLRTFSKIYGLAGFRVGFGIASKEIIAKMEPVREPFNVNAIGQLAAKAALADQEFVESCKLKNDRERKRYYEFCEENGISYYPTEGNFILINVSEDSQTAFQYFLQNGVITRSGAALGFPGWLRITIGKPEENDKVFQLLKERIQK